MFCFYNLKVLFTNNYSRPQIMKHELLKYTLF